VNWTLHYIRTYLKHETMSFLVKTFQKQLHIHPSFGQLEYIIGQVEYTIGQVKNKEQNKSSKITYIVVFIVYLRS